MEAIVPDESQKRKFDVDAPPGTMFSFGSRLARSGKMVTFVDDQMTVISHLILHNAFSNHALNQGHIQHAIGFIATAPDSTDVLP